MITTSHLLVGLAGLFLGAQLPAQSPPIVVYKTNFDSLTPGFTTSPAAPGHDGWYSVLAAPPAFGEIQTSTAIGAAAIHEFTGIANPNGQQTIDKRDLVPPDLTANPIITLAADFYCSSSDLTAVNNYTAGVECWGGPHPGFMMIGFGLAAGNGTPKASNLHVGVGAFDGTNNNFPIPLVVGQQLAWDSWHRLVLIADQGADQWVSLTVDGVTQDLTAYPLPRSGAVRGQLIEGIQCQIIPNDFNFQGTVYETDDDVYFDNLRLTVSPAGQANSGAASLAVNGYGASIGRGPFLAPIPSSAINPGTAVFDWTGPPSSLVIVGGGALVPGSMNLGCIGSVDLGLGGLTTLYIAILDNAGRSTQSFPLPPTLVPGPLFAVQGAAVQPTGCQAVLTAAGDIHIAPR